VSVVVGAVLTSYYDIALRDFGLMVGALALWRLSVQYTSSTR
jgi:hypothetical protein